MRYFVKRIFFFCVAATTFFSQRAFTQPNVLDPNDPVITYDPLHPAATPPPNTLAKWVRSRVYSWNTDKFKSYYFDGMAFRLRFPTGYNPADSTKKYPVIVCYHGGGEVAPITNNEIQLLYPAQKLEAYADAGQYNAFLLFPVHSQETGIWDDFEFSRVNRVLDSMKKYCNLDEDRVLTMGLSMGAFASIRYSAWYPQRSTLAIGASPALIETLTDEFKNKLLHIPLWVGNGEQDINPYPFFVQNFVSYINSKGGNIRHSYYPGQGHKVWGLQFEEGYFLPYLLAAHKANPVVFFGRKQFDAESAVNSRIGISAGFYEYEWQRDNITIATSTNGINKFIDSSAVTSSSGNEISVRTYGSYRARFRRTSSSGWSAWSPNPAVIYRGLKYRYYEGAWNYLPDFNAMGAPTETGTSPNADLNAKPPGREDHFSMIWEGKIYIPTPGDYTFETVSDDGSKLYFNTAYSANATALVNNDGTHGVTAASGTVRVPAAGSYPVAITYFNSLGSGTFRLYWSGPGFAKQLVPNAAFTQRGDNTDDIAPGAPANVRATDNGRTSVILRWNKSTDNVGVAKYTVFMNGVEKGSTTDSTITINNLAPNINYTVSVVALDAAGNMSDSSNAITVLCAANGLQYKFYSGSWTAIPNFNLLTPVKSGTTQNVSLDIRPAGADNYYTIIWEGWINIRTPGDYTFETVSDDGSKLYFNTFYSPTATPLVNNDGVHQTASVSGTVRNLAAGLYPITISYLQLGGGANMQVYWSGPTIARQLIPDIAFIENYPDKIAPTAPSNIKVDYTGRTFADISWEPSTDNVGIAKYDVYVNSYYKFSTTSTSVKVDSLTPNSSYYFEVKASDAAGNISSSTYTQSVTTAANGLKYKFYTGFWPVIPDFNTLTPLKKGTSSNVDLRIRPVGINTGYTVVWEGYINIKTPGDYTFETVSDDGSKLYFNTFYSPTATPLVNNDGVHQTASVSGTVRNLAAGLYPITISYLQLGGEANIEVYWSGPSTSRQRIPDAAFTEYYNGYSTTIAGARSGGQGVASDLVGQDKNPIELAGVYPNPFNKDLKISFYNTASSNDISVSIHDLSGRLLYTKRYGKVPQGTALLQLDLGGALQLKAGTYMARLQVNGTAVKTWKLVKSKE